MNPESPRFTVSLIGHARTHLERLATLAEQHDLRALLLEVLQSVMANLETRPREWGDPYINYRGLEAIGYRRAVLPAGILVEYAAHNTNPLVWVSNIFILTDSPFAG